MPAIAESRKFASRRSMGDWLPLAGLPVAVGLVGAAWPPWIFMWALAFSIYAALKWLTFADCPAAKRATPAQTWGYLLLWPGMDAAAFFADTNEEGQPPPSEWWSASAKFALGLLLIFGAARLAIDLHPLLAGWAGVIGVVFTLHFGLFHVLSLAWRRAGVNAPPLMQAPILASSLAEFWGRRWNLAFRDVARAYVFRPLLRRCGTGGATTAVFIASGLIHDLVISLPARAGWGLPTLYFVIQAAGVLFERSRLGKRLAIGHGARGRVFCAAVTLAPLPLLFHPPFVERVVLPMLAAMGAI